MKIAITGAHSQGKTTLVDALQKLPEFKDWKFFTEITRTMKEMGFEINEKAAPATQLFMMAEHYRRVNVEGNCIFDRCALDGLVYSAVLTSDHGMLDGLCEDEYDDIVEAIQCMFDATMNKYDLVFYIVPELPLKDDGVRTIDETFFNRIVQCFNFMIDWNKVNMILVKGSVEERVKIITDAIKEKQAE